MFKIKKIILFICLISSFYTDELEHSIIINYIIGLICIGLSLPHFLKYGKSLKLSTFYCRIENNTTQKYVNIMAFVIFTIVVIILLRKYNISMPAYNGLTILIMISSGFLNHHSSFIYSIKVFKERIELPGFNPTPILIKNITHIDRKDTQVHIKSQNENKYTYMVNKKDLKDFDKLIEIWQNNHSG